MESPSSQQLKAISTLPLPWAWQILYFGLISCTISTFPLSLSASLQYFVLLNPPCLWAGKQGPKVFKGWTLQKEWTFSEEVNPSITSLSREKYCRCHYRGSLLMPFSTKSQSFRMSLEGRKMTHTAARSSPSPPSMCRNPSFESGTGYVQWLFKRDP